MKEKSVLYKVKHHIALIVFNRANDRNTITQDFLVNFYNALDDVAANKDIRAAVLTGNGRSFCSGVDIFARRTENIFNPRGDGKDFPDVIAGVKKPIIGAINGHAISAGLEIALHCDFLLGSERACFSDTHARARQHPGWGLTQLLPEAVGRRWAKQMIYTCQFVYAEKALQIGLLNEKVEHEHLLTRAMELAENICSVNQPMLKRIKSLIEYEDIATKKVATAHERRGFLAFIKKSGGR